MLILGSVGSGGELGVSGTTLTSPCPNSVSIADECITAFNDFRMSGGSKTDKTKFIIFKIADNKKEVVIDESSKDEDYEVFRSKLEAAKDSKGNPAPRYAVYDVEYELGGGEGKRYDDRLRSLRVRRSIGFLTFFSLDTEARSSSSLGSPATLPLSYVSNRNLFLVADGLSNTDAGSLVVHDLRQHPRKLEERPQHPQLHPR